MPVNMPTDVLQAVLGRLVAIQHLLLLLLLVLLLAHVRAKVERGLLLHLSLLLRIIIIIMVFHLFEWIVTACVNH